MRKQKEDNEMKCISEERFNVLINLIIGLSILLMAGIFSFAYLISEDMFTVIIASFIAALVYIICSVIGLQVYPK